MMYSVNTGYTSSAGPYFGRVFVWGLPHPWDVEVVHLERRLIYQLASIKFRRDWDKPTYFSTSALSLLRPAG